MAHIEDRGEQRNGRRWRVRWRDPDGKHRARSFDRKADAQRFLYGLAADLDAGTYSDPRGGRVTVDDLARDYLARKDALRKPKTAAGYREVYRNLVHPRWGTTPVGKITQNAVQTWVAQMSARYSPSRTRQAHRLLADIVDDAALAVNPARNVEDLPRMPMRRAYSLLSHSQVAALADAAGEIGGPTDRALVLVLAYGGLRWSEAVALRWADWDEIGKRLTIARAEPEVNGRLVSGSPKTHQARRVALALPAASALATLDRTTPRVFQTPRGAPMRSGAWRARVLTPACHAVGLPVISPHALRHTAASLAIQSGASVKAVQRMLGHSRASYTITLDVYADIHDSDLDDLAARMTTAAKAAPGWEPPPQIAQR